MAALLNFWNSPTKSRRTSMNGTSSDTAKGTKRKAKTDPYEDMGEDEEEVIPARKTPTSQRSAARSRPLSATPGSSSRPPRSSLPSSGKRTISRVFIILGRPGRPSLKSQQGDTSDMVVASKTSAESNLARAKASDAVHVQPDSLVPEAPMGGLELLGNNTTGALAPSVSKPRTKTVDGPPPQGKGKVKQTVTRSAQQTRGEVGGREKQEENGEQEQQEEEPEEDTREEHEIAKLLEHRMTSNGSGAVELLVQWVDEGEQDATWEAEDEIQQGAEELLYKYWDAQGGRIRALFHKPKNAPPEIYHVFKVLRHEKKNRGGFQFEIQWVGHSAARADTTMEAETKLKNIAPELLREYWESVGGRASHLAPRGRAKKPRTE
ncbi:hypothetical protein GQX73_g10412 [Xylaria multiplex]|uniref:Chromo domain-containing protein n=1 Tax=Xylaria multiplex TaxID=323545 RepID=A0A7C8IGL6_9PEZI|nr:hypothetical protein GQX73_g10412 [Xylaria multiplex]